MNYNNAMESSMWIFEFKLEFEHTDLTVERLDDSGPRIGNVCSAVHFRFMCVQESSGHFIRFTEEV